MAKDCWFKRPPESNVANLEKKSEDDWDVIASLALEEEWDAEASSCWCSENEALPDPKDLEDTL